MPETYTGHCNCGSATYTLSGPPIVINACHCTYCQRESGSAFALNAFFESDRMNITAEPSLERTPLSTKSGREQHQYRCPKCKVVLYSLYGQPGNGDFMRVLKVGTLDEESRVRGKGVWEPTVHIYTGNKHSWVSIEDGKPKYEAQAKPKECWPKEALERMGVVTGKIKAAQAKGKEGGGKAKL